MSEESSVVVDLDEARRQSALQTWVQKCRSRMQARWPTIDFYSIHWPINTNHNTKLLDISFAPILADFADKDPSFVLALKCLIAEVAMKGEVKIPGAQLSGWRLLSRLEVPLFKLRRSHLVGLETTLVEQAKASPKSAGSIHGDLLRLQADIDFVGAEGLTDRLAWTVGHTTKTELLRLGREWRANFRAGKASVLDRQIEALSDAHTAMFRGDERLSNYDRVALAVMGINMCCPNRVNEPLCMSVNDRFTVEDYKTPESASGLSSNDLSLVRVHQMLLVKGSKGANWGAKPILNFMISFADMCMTVIKQHGERSRMLVSWYEKHPNTLFLPPELEHLRGSSEIDRPQLWQIMSLENRIPTHGELGRTGPIWAKLHKGGSVKRIGNRKSQTLSGRNPTRPTIQVVAWRDLEPVLLARVSQTLEDIRRVTTWNSYLGRLSDMLVLFDGTDTPYLPGSIKYNALKRRLLQNKSDKKRGKDNAPCWSPEPTLFEKLGIKMVVNGVVQTAYIGTHDPRRWLTTQAIDSGLPDVLANKWANRLDLNQLKHYDLASPERKAQRSAMPDIPELTDMSDGLAKLGKLEADYGLKTDVLVVGDAKVAMTSIDEVMRATEERPVARTSNQIIILYPQRYGVCLHQHHERPCRAYKCAPCNEGVVVKGHLPTNERIRKDADLVFRSVVNQLEGLLIARQRQLADNPETLDQHLLTLVREGLNPEAMAKDLIARFHEIKDHIKDRSFANMLTDAFALNGYVERIDSDGVQSGALIKFHNPSCHAAPGHERAMEARHGGRSEINASIESFDREFPQFAPSTLGIQDQRAAVRPESDEGKDFVDD